MKPTTQKTCATAGAILFAALATFTVTARADFGSRIFAPKSMRHLSPGSTRALNPQPIPPGRPVLGERKALNPQPIPPGRGGVQAIRNPGDPPPAARPGDKQALNPQPIPPGRPVLGEQNALNPQPIPPGRGVMTPIRNPGDPPPAARYGRVRARSL
jgi:hypothetical protein